ncbi:FG-GAP-like repeat-containing protein [Roseateles chitinivorans]|uniref:FG-GAP-like repeat-containing protein n=1 Tax=Roseateles chitinivorans TaxID=2917965 RepID=UPI003D6758A6
MEEIRHPAVSGARASSGRPLIRGGLVAVSLVAACAGAWPAAGTTSASFSVTNGGAASYQIPIPVPPGVAGLQPKLSLQYDSQAGRTMMGPGWSLEGFPAIRRCPQSRSQDKDKVRGAVQLTAADRFCYQGQRLVMPSGQKRANNVARDYGEADSTYQLELDNFSRFRARGSAGTGPQYFELEEKSGLKLEFGNTADSRYIGRAAKSGAAAPTTVVAWYLNKVTDRSGNTMSFAYTNGSGEIVPDTISYAGGRAKVKLGYVADKNPRKTFIAGVSIDYTKLLSTVTTTLTDDAGNEREVRQYRLGYEFADVRGTSATDEPVGRVVSLTECPTSSATAADCLPALSFDWDAWTTSDRKIGTPRVIGNPADPVHKFAFSSNRFAGIPVEGGRYLRRLADLNGDGHLDIVAFWRDGVYAYLSNADGSFPAEPTRVTTQFGIDDGWEDNEQPASPFYPRSLIDMNGDGYPDIVAFSNNPYSGPGQGGWVAFWNPSTNRFDDRQLLLPAGELAGQGRYCGSASQIDDMGAPRFLLDLDGDGYPDVLRFTDKGGTASFWNPTTKKFGTPVAVTDQFRMSRDNWYGSGCTDFLTFQPIFMEDLNGDGFADIIGVSFGGPWVAYWDPKGKVFSKPFNAGGGVVATRTAARIHMADMNGDGYPDLVQLDKDGVYVSLWSGTEFLTRTRWTTTMSGGAWDSNQSMQPRMFVDVNGDGYPDLVGFDAAGVNVALSNGRDALAASVVWSADYFNSTYPQQDKAQQVWFEPYKTPRFLQDLDGDGTPDIVGYSDRAMVWSPLPRMPGARIRKFTDGLGATVELTYDVAQPFSAAYSKPSQPSTYPQRDAHGPRQIVSSVNQSDGRGGLRKISYSYGERRLDVDRGDLGFAWMQFKDERSGLTTRRTFSQSYPYIGWLLREQVSLNGRTVGDTNHTLANETLDSAQESPDNVRRFVYVRSTSQESRDPGGSLLSSSTSVFDYGKTANVQWGDLTRKTVTWPGELEVVTDMVYTADADRWLLGLMTSQTETRKKPAVTLSATTSIEAPGRAVTPLPKPVSAWLPTILSLLLED